MPWGTKFLTKNSPEIQIHVFSCDFNVDSVMPPPPTVSNHLSLALLPSELHASLTWVRFHVRPFRYLQTSIRPDLQTFSLPSDLQTFSLSPCRYNLKANLYGRHLDGTVWRHTPLVPHAFMTPASRPCYHLQTLPLPPDLQTFSLPPDLQTFSLPSDLSCHLPRRLLTMTATLYFPLSILHRKTYRPHKHRVKRWMKDLC